MPEPGAEERLAPGNLEVGSPVPGMLGGWPSQVSVAKCRAPAECKVATVGLEGRRKAPLDVVATAAERYVFEARDRRVLAWTWRSMLR